MPAFTGLPSAEERPHDGAEKLGDRYVRLHWNAIYVGIDIPVHRVDKTRVDPSADPGDAPSSGSRP